jgi:hypothetical protein
MPAGHKDAWERAELLHRDISPENIMKVVNQDVEVDNTINGILNDWDLCKHKSELNAEATQHGRSVRPELIVAIRNDLIYMAGNVGLYVCRIFAVSS